MNDPSDPYAAIAAWYDVEHDRFTADVEFYQTVIAVSSGARINALEIGSGTGRLAAALALAGWAITGVEPSAAMRERCAARLAKLPPPVARRITVIAGTATALNLPVALPNGAFDAAIIALGTFAHLLSAEERMQALVAIRPYLRAGGKLVIDLDLAGPRDLAAHPGRHVRLGTWRIPASASNEAGGSRILTHNALGMAGPMPETVAIQHAYIVHEGRAEISRTKTTTTLALLTSESVSDELRWAGYRVAAVYGDYNLAPYRGSSPRALIVARISQCQFGVKMERNSTPIL